MMARRHNQMNYKTIRLLVAVLLLSQWFSLAHATDDHFIDDEPECQICHLNSENGQATMVEHAQDLFPVFPVYDSPHYIVQYHSFNRFVKTIRGPPSTPVV